MKHILITGGAGFIGSNLALKLVSKGYQVRVLDNLSQQIHGEHPDKTSPLYNSIKGKVDFIRGAVTVREDWLKALDIQPLKLVATTEDSLVHPTSVYGITKQVQGQLVHLVCPSIGIAAVSYRYQNVYGPGQSLSNPYTGILSIFSTRIKNGNGLNIFEDGKETRDFVYIDDVVDATILGIEKEEANGHVFNVGTGVPTDVLTVAKTLIEKYGKEVPVTVSGNYRLGDIRHNFADITAARTILGFEPKWSFSDGIGEFVKWVNAQEVQEDKYEASIEEMRRKGLYK